MGRRGLGKGDPQCPQLTAARSSTAPLGTASGVQGSAQGCRAQGCSGKRPWYQDTPFGSRNPSALPSWCCSHAEPRCPRVNVTALPSATAGLGWARVGRESPEEREGYKTRGTHSKTAFEPEPGCRWTHKAWQKDHPPNQSPPPRGSSAGQGTAVLAPQKG